MFDVAIVGRGLAGTVIGYILAERGVKVAAVGSDAIAPNMPPIALLQPFAGRSLKYVDSKWRAWLAAQAFWSRPELRNFVTQIRVRRPLDGEGGERLRRSFSDHGHRYPDIDLKFTANEISYVGYLIAIRDALADMSQKLSCHSGLVSTISASACDYLLEGDRVELRAQHCILATGPYRYLGQPLTGPWQVDYGAMIQVPHAKVKAGAVCTQGLQHMTSDKWSWIGSTRSDSIAAARLDTGQLVKAHEHWTESKSNVLDIWAGTRVATSDRLPIVDKTRLGVYYVSGLAGRGTMWAPFAGELLRAHLLDGHQLPDEIAFGRFSS